MATVLPLRSMSSAVTARLFKAWVAPSAPRSNTLPPIPLAVRASARGVDVALLMVDAISMTAAAPVAASVLSAPNVTAPV